MSHSACNFLKSERVSKLINKLICMLKKLGLQVCGRAGLHLNHIGLT